MYDLPRLNCLDNEEMEARAVILDLKFSCMHSYQIYKIDLCISDFSGDCYKRAELCLPPNLFPDWMQTKTLENREQNSLNLGMKSYNFWTSRHFFIA